MDLHSKMTMYVTSTMTSPVTKTAKTSKWLRLNLFLIMKTQIPESILELNVHEKVYITQ